MAISSPLTSREMMALDMVTLATLRSAATVAVGCTGGRHRSVVLAEEISRLIAEQGYHPTVNHRDISR